MISDEDLRKMLRDFIKVPVTVFAAIVKAVDLDKYVIDVEPIGQTEMLDVRLKAGIDDIKDGIVEIPKVGSSVLIGLIGNDKNTAFVVKCSEVEEIIINNGDLGGIPISEKVMDNLKAIKDYVQAMKSAIENGLTSVGAGTAASGSAGSAAFTSAMAGQTITFDDIENDKIKQ